MKWIALCLATLVATAWPAAAQADPIVYRTAPSADVSLPFWCDWGYVLGRALLPGLLGPALRRRRRPQGLALCAPLPAGRDPAGVDRSSGDAPRVVRRQGVCLAPRKTERPCPARSYTIDIHPIFGADWLREREVEIGPEATHASFWASTSQRLSWDVTDVVIAWIEHGAPNDGVLLKLADGEEDFCVSGPRLPSSEFADAARRPALEVTYLPP